MKCMILVVITFILLSPVFIGRTKKTPPPNAQKYSPEISVNIRNIMKKCMFY